MDAMDVLTETRERMSQGTPFGEPITHDGVVVIPVSRIGGMVGAGTGNRSGAAEGAGGGLGMRAAPVGAFVIRNGRVVWRPAVDVNKIILGGQVVAIVALLTLRSLVKARRRGLRRAGRRSAVKG